MHQAGFLGCASAHRVVFTQWQSQIIIAKGGFFSESAIRFSEIWDLEIWKNFITLSEKKTPLGISHTSLRFVIYCVAFWAERFFGLLFLQVKLSSLQFCFVSRGRESKFHTGLICTKAIQYFKLCIRFKQKRYSFH